MSIRQLEQDVINKIAAGEVVERPSSVVKELVENAIDAQATQIKVDIDKGGVAKIQVTDNGIGIFQDELHLAIARHATSKISSIHDLSNISSMGFRGEALSSISSVAEFELRSKPVEQKVGKKLSNLQGDWKIEDVGMANGTIVNVQNLFFNIPARRKFLKSEKTEFSYIISLILDFALIHPEISFIITHNKKEIVHLPKTESVFFRVQEVFGKTLAQQMIPVSYKEELIQISGYISKPESMQNTRLNQHVFVNNRPVKDITVLKAIREGLGHLLAHDKHPAFFLHIQIRPDLVDVNVHPRKTEVKFVHNGLIFQAMQQALWEAFNKQQIFTDEAGKFLFDDKSHEENKLEFGKNPLPEKKVDYKSQFFKEAYTHVYQGHLKPIKPDAFSQPIKLKTAPSFRLLGQLQNKYILIEKEGKLLVIDQHAAHEGLTYKRLLLQKTRNSPRTQKKLTPEIIEVTQQEKEMIENNLELFTRLGFQIESFGNTSFALQGVPPEMSKYNLSQVVKGMVEDMAHEGSKIHTLENKYDLLVKYASCRYAIMFQDPLSNMEMQKLVEDIFTFEVEACAHGRPVFFSLDIEELAKKFHRH